MWKKLFRLRYKQKGMNARYQNTLPRNEPICGARQPRKTHGTFIKLLNSIEKLKHVILDDFGMPPMDANTQLAMMQMLEDRYGRKSTIIVSQLPFDKWRQSIEEPTLAHAIMNRLSASAHKIN